MTDIYVDTRAQTIAAAGQVVGCVIGRSGAVAAADKREGDGCTPLGRFPIRALLVRPGEAAPATALPWRWLRRNCGWSDDVADPAYNRPVTHPHAFSAEHLWRSDGLYDLIVVFGHNDAPPRAPLGSAIFLHCQAVDGSATEGCVAMAKPHLRVLAEAMVPGDWLHIR